MGVCEVSVSEILVGEWVRAEVMEAWAGGSKG